jgi:GGDEF domain-containing protein
MRCADGRGIARATLDIGGLARLAGDEFAIAFIATRSGAEAEQLAERLLLR